MNVAFDERLSREAKKGFILFMHAESQRHQHDIDAIHERIKECEEYLELSEEEKIMLYREGYNYVAI